MNIEKEIKELARLYELAEHEKEKAELLGRVNKLESKNAELDMLAATAKLEQRSTMELESRLELPRSGNGLLCFEFEDALKKRGIWSEHVDFLGKTYFIVRYVALHNDSELRNVLFAHPSVIVSIDASDFKAVYDKDKIRRLVVEGRSSEDMGVKLPELLASCPNLEMLDIEGDIGDKGAEAIARSQYVQNLKILRLWGDGIGSQGAEVIAESGNLGNLVYLNLSGNPIGDLGVKAIATSPNMARLNYLDLSSTHIKGSDACTSVVVQRIATSPHMARLTHLSFAYNDIKSEGAQVIADSKHLAKLVYLDLGNNGIGNKGAKAIANSWYVGNLKHLDLGGNKITEAGARAIAEGSALGYLDHLDLSHNPISDAGERVIRARFSHAQLSYGDDKLQWGEPKQWYAPVTRLLRRVFG